MPSKWTRWDELSIPVPDDRRIFLQYRTAGGWILFRIRRVHWDQYWGGVVYLESVRCPGQDDWGWKTMGVVNRLVDAGEASWEES